MLLKKFLVFYQCELVPSGFFETFDSKKSAFDSVSIFYDSCLGYPMSCSAFVFLTVDFLKNGLSAPVFDSAD